MPPRQPVTKTPMETLSDAVTDVVVEFLSNHYLVFGNVRSRSFSLIITLIPEELSTRNFISGVEFNGWHQVTFSERVQDEANLKKYDIVEQYREIRCNMFYDEHASKIHVNDFQLIPRYDQKDRSSDSPADWPGKNQSRGNTGSWHSDTGN